MYLNSISANNADLRVPVSFETFKIPRSEDGNGKSKKSETVLNGSYKKRTSPPFDWIILRIRPTSQPTLTLVCLSDWKIHVSPINVTELWIFPIFIGKGSYSMLISRQVHRGSFGLTCKFQTFFSESLLMTWDKGAWGFLNMVLILPKKFSKANAENLSSSKSFNIGSQMN